MQAVEEVVDLFSRMQSPGLSETELKDLHAKIGRLAVDSDLLFQGLKQLTQSRRRNSSAAIIPI